MDEDEKTFHLYEKYANLVQSIASSISQAAAWDNVQLDRQDPLRYLKESDTLRVRANISDLEKVCKELGIGSPF